MAKREARAGDEGAGAPGTRALCLAKALLAQSALRRRLFGGVFRQPTWDMLLGLYVARHEGGELTMRTLCASSGEAFGTAERLVLMMEQDGLLRRRGDGDGARPTVVEITDEAAAFMERLLLDVAAGAHLAGDTERPCRSGASDARS